jgi:hypothetical protein
MQNILIKLSSKLRTKWTVGSKVDLRPKDLGFEFRRRQKKKIRRNLTSSGLLWNSGNRKILHLYSTGSGKHFK